MGYTGIYHCLLYAITMTSNTRLIVIDIVWFILVLPLVIPLLVISLAYIAFCPRYNKDQD
jgi:hypothetical protein